MVAAMPSFYAGWWARVPNLFPEEVVQAADVSVEIDADVSFGRSWRFDYDAGEFMLTPTGKVAHADARDAWVEWCQKAMHTERYHYLAYTRSHGHEFDDLIGSKLSRPALESEIQRMVIEALLVNPRTASVGSFQFTWESDRCIFQCEVTSVRDETGSISGSVVNT